MHNMKTVRIMDYLDNESECLSSSIFSIAHTAERLPPDTHRRQRKSPRKKPKISGTSALVIDQLKNAFRRPGDFVPRMRTRRNWRPEFLIKFFRDNRSGCNEECSALQCDKSRTRNFIAETPEIYTVGLHSGARILRNNNDPSSTRKMIKNLKKCFGIGRREQKQCICNEFSENTITRKCWITRFIASSCLSTAMPLKESLNEQMIIINNTANAFKLDFNQKNNHHHYHDQLSECTKERDSIGKLGKLQNTYEGDLSFILKFHDLFLRGNKTLNKYGASCAMKKDAQIQTSSKKGSRRKRMKRRRSKLRNEGILRKHNDDELILTTPYSRTVGHFSAGPEHSSDRINTNESSRLSVRILESKHSGYINKFTAVNRQIEEITATLRETCYSGRNVRKCEKCLSPMFDNVEMNTKRKLYLNDNGSNCTIFPARKKESAFKNKGDSVRVNKLKESDSDRNKNVRKISHDDNADKEDSVFFTERYPKDAVAVSMNPDEDPWTNDAFVHDSLRAITIKKIARPSKETLRNGRKARCRLVKQISFDLDLIRDDDAMRELSMQDESSLNEIHLRNNLVQASDDEHASDLIQSIGLEESEYYRTILEEKTGEMSILKDIKRRIDRDFDDPSLNDGNETDEFLTISQKSSDFESGGRSFYRTPSQGSATCTMMDEESRSTPRIVSGLSNLDYAGMRIRDSTSTVSEYSNKSSSLSKYFSCSGLPSLASLRENDDLVLEDRDANPRDLNPDLSSINDRSNIVTDLDRSRSNLRTYARCNSSSRSVMKTIDPSDTVEISEGQERLVENELRDLLGENDERADTERHYTEDCTLETSKSSKYIGSIDSGVFVSSSLIDLYPHESSFNGSKSELKQKRGARKADGSFTFDFSSDNSYTDDSLDRKVDDVVKDLTYNLILCERRARMKLREIWKARSRSNGSRYSRYSWSHNSKIIKDPCDASDFDSRWFDEDENIIDISTPSLLSLSGSESENFESNDLY